MLRIGFPPSAKFNKKKAESSANLERMTEAVGAIVGTRLRPAYELIEDCAKENVRYVEVRFSPMLHTREGLSHAVVLESVLAWLPVTLDNSRSNSRCARTRVRRPIPRVRPR